MSDRTAQDLADGGQNTQTTPKLEAGLGADDDGQQETQT